MFLDQAVDLDLGTVGLDGHLVMPVEHCGIVVFAHGSGSGRHSPRNRYVAEALQRAGLGTVLVDLLTPEEERRDAVGAELRFDISLLAGRVAGIVDWLATQRATGDNPVGLFGASTGAAAALVTASERPAAVHAVVSRGGRPDLAGDALSRVGVPTLLIVGGADERVLDFNREALDLLPPASRLEVVAGATHLFQEPGALEQVATLAGDWLAHHLGTAPTAPPTE